TAPTQERVGGTTARHGIAAVPVSRLGFRGATRRNPSTWPREGRKGTFVDHRRFSPRATVGALALRAVLALAAAMAAPACAPTARRAGARTAAIARGRMIGGVGADTATVWVRISAPGSVRVRWHAGQSGDWSYSPTVVTGSDADDTAKVALPSLAAGTTYSY